MIDMVIADWWFGRLRLIYRIVDRDRVIYRVIYVGLVGLKI